MKWSIHRLPKRKVANPFRLPILAQLQHTLSQGPAKINEL